MPETMPSVRKDGSPLSGGAVFYSTTRKCIFRLRRRGRFIIANGRTNGPRSRPAMISSPLATFAQPLDPSAEKSLAKIQEQLQKLEHRD
jgi:hypothetical protein